MNSFGLLTTTELSNSFINSVWVQYSTENLVYHIISYYSVGVNKYQLMHY